ncbi:MAG: hypothetical protein IPM53_19890 [Anaerolineaceae bacterium]|nr:hypothetical protein [Anaerolineaceae bacterium]
MKYSNSILFWLVFLSVLTACTTSTPQSVTVSLSMLSTLFWSGLGLISLCLGLFLPQLNRLMGTPSQEKRFAVPKFKRTAEVNGRIARLVLIMLGLGMILNGLGPHLLPARVVSLIAYALLALAFLGILLMIIVTTGNWRA